MVYKLTEYDLKYSMVEISYWWSLSRQKTAYEVTPQSELQEPDQCHPFSNMLFLAMYFLTFSSASLFPQIGPTSIFFSSITL